MLWAINFKLQDIIHFASLGKTEHNLGKKAVTKQKQKKKKKPKQTNKRKQKNLRKKKLKKR